MKKGFFCRLVVILTVLSVMLQPFYVRAGTLDQIRSIAKSVLSGEPEEVEELRQMEVAQSEEGHQEYYFKQLNEEEQRVYRELLKGIRAREKDFYLTLSQDDSIDRCYHAVLKDHPEIFWVHNHEKIYKTTYASFQKTQCNCVLIKVFVQFFQKLVGFGAKPQGLYLFLS